MMNDLIKQSKSKFLSDQIKDAEWQVLNHQRVIDFRTAALVGKIYQQLTEPASLLLFGGIGFILGEITKGRIAKSHSAIDKAHSSEISPLKVALNLLTSMRTLYTALPLAWIMKSRYQPGASGRVLKRKSRSAPTSGATHERRRSNRP